MNRILKNGLVVTTVFTALTLGACATDGYYGGGATYSTYPYTRPYVYPSSGIYLRYSSPRYYPGYYRGYRPYYYPRHYRVRPAPRYRYYGAYPRYRGGYPAYHGTPRAIYRGGHRAYRGGHRGYRRGHR